MYYAVLVCGKYLSLSQKATFTNAINIGNSASGPITPAKSFPLLIPKTPTATAIATSKLLPAAVKALDAFVE